MVSEEKICRSVYQSLRFAVQLRMKLAYLFFIANRGLRDKHTATCILYL